MWTSVFGNHTRIFQYAVYLFLFIWFSSASGTAYPIQPAHLQMAVMSGQSPAISPSPIPAPPTSMYLFFKLIPPTFLLCSSGFSSATKPQLNTIAPYLGCICLITTHWHIVWSHASVMLLPYFELISSVRSLRFYCVFVNENREAVIAEDGRTRNDCSTTECEHSCRTSHHRILFLLFPPFANFLDALVVCLPWQFHGRDYAWYDARESVAWPSIRFCAASRACYRGLECEEAAGAAEPDRPTRKARRGRRGITALLFWRLATTACGGMLFFFFHASNMICAGDAHTDCGWLYWERDDFCLSVGQTSQIRYAGGEGHRPSFRCALQLTERWYSILVLNVW